MALLKAVIDETGQEYMYHKIKWYDVDCYDNTVRFIVDSFKCLETRLTNKAKNLGEYFCIVDKSIATLPQLYTYLKTMDIFVDAEDLL